MNIDSIIWKLFSPILNNLNVHGGFILDVSGQSARFELGLIRYNVLRVGYAYGWRWSAHRSHLRGRHITGRPVTDRPAV